MIVEKDEERAKALAETMDALVIHGDGSDSEILKDAGIEKADAVLILTKDDNTNLTICQMVKKFNVRRIAARVNDPSKQDLFIALEITAAISPIAAVVSYFKNAITQESRRSIGSIAGGRAEILEINVSNEKLYGRKIRDIGLPSGAMVGMIMRDGDVIVKPDEDILRKNDILTVIVKTGVSKDVIKILRGGK